MLVSLQVFCLEHRTYKAHCCPKAEHNSRMVVVCRVCSMSIEKKAGEVESTILERHERSGDCDASKKHKPGCPVRRCKELLTFSNNITCKICNQNVCLKHRFPSDHACRPPCAKDARTPLRLPARNGTDCRDGKSSSVASHQSLLTSH